MIWRCNDQPSCWLAVMEELCEALDLCKFETLLFKSCDIKSCSKCKHYIIYDPKDSYTRL